MDKGAFLTEKVTPPRARVRAPHSTPPRTALLDMRREARLPLCDKLLY